MSLLSTLRAQIRARWPPDGVKAKSGSGLSAKVVAGGVKMAESGAAKVVHNRGEAG
jgi:hypothetical protein